ncbi:hypothetical protein ACFT25_40515 [Streptomyces hydrogenans]|uniref:hypothetical protein n=1 Tax=Streptomyces hydrogenans TaxID=1873719 RepID=UPI003624D71F
MKPKGPRPKPAGTSPIAAAPIPVNTHRPRVGDQLGDQEQQEEGLFAEPRRTVRQKPKPGRTRGGRSAPPAAADAIPTTIRFDPEEAAAIDLWVLALREEAGRRQLDKAEVFRELTRLAREHEPTHKALMRRLR